MTTRMRLIAALVAVAIVGAWFGLLWRPATRELNGARAALVTAQQDRLTAAIEHEAVRARVARLPAEEAEARALAAAVPTSPDLIGVIDEVNRIAAASGVTWQSQSQTFGTATGSTGTASSTPTTDPSGVSGAVPLTIDLEVTGKTAQILSFVTLLTSAPRVMQVSGLSVALADVMTGATTGAPSSTASATSETHSTSIAATLFVDAAPLPKAPKVPGSSAAG